MSIGDINKTESLTSKEISAIGPLMGRIKINDEVMPARFPEGTFERMDSLLGPKEKRSDLIRAAVERELGRRERAAKRLGDETEKPD